MGSFSSLLFRYLRTMGFLLVPAVLAEYMIAVRPAKRPVNRLVRKRGPPLGSWSRPIVLDNISTLDGSQSSPIVIEDDPELSGSISKPIELEDDSDEGTSPNPIVLVDDPGHGLDQGSFIVRLQRITIVEEWVSSHHYAD
ncbi:hypothetical protein CSAL01_10043 [Colletotrichum salicis]|uniref:Uncharacterized protein n=1 Tax=Colletotrichum salicis TaxID=1209931 RepID=A0A135U2C7_9PEZI|nr:hypothetical protein CSAL01_10043 [Colletotrichum salicis]